MTRLLVCGSRDFGEGKNREKARKERMLMFSILDSQFSEPFPPAEAGFRIATVECVIEGECPYGGADKLAKAWAEFYQIPVEPYPPDIKDGRILGPQRNAKMLKEGRPDICVGFINKPLAQSRGTKDMLTKANAAGVFTWHVEVW